jgi:hypothetical protein
MGLSTRLDLLKSGKTLSIGVGRLMANTQPRALTIFNLRGLSVSWELCQSRKQRLNQNVNFLPRLCYTKNLTTNNLMKRQWPNDPICKLCGVELETPTQLCKDCVFLKQVWPLLKQWLGLSLLYSVATNGSLHNYWCRCHKKIEKYKERCLTVSWYIFGGMFGTNGIEGLFRIRCYNQDKLHSYARKR